MRRSGFRAALFPWDASFPENFQRLLARKARKRPGGRRAFDIRRHARSIASKHSSRTLTWP